MRSWSAIALACLLVATIVGACSTTFDPSMPCTADGAGDGATRGTFPELEAAVPTAFRGGPPSALDSGRTCSTAGLSTLAGHGITELRFAGATWETGKDSGVSLATFATGSGPALTPAWLAEFYETGARSGKNVQKVETSDYSVGGDMGGKRVDVLNGESYQTVIVWSRDQRVAAALIGNFIRDIQTREAHEKVVREAVDAFAIRL
jgi:hypothetical protein